MLPRTTRDHSLSPIGPDWRKVDHGSALLQRRHVDPGPTDELKPKFVQTLISMYRPRKGLDRRRVLGLKGRARSKDRVVRHQRATKQGQSETITRRVECKCIRTDHGKLSFIIEMQQRVIPYWIFFAIGQAAKDSTQYAIGMAFERIEWDC